jgi:NAD(P)-dependent dehydrogenase (short-subunit alcohol dehydrogenase family)
VDTGLRGDVVAILGAAGGIGTAIAQAFAAEGCALAVVDRNPSVMALAAGLHHAHGVGTVGLVADATDYAAVQDAARSGSGRASSACRSGRWSRPTGTSSCAPT